MRRSRNFNSDSEDDLPELLKRKYPDFALSLCGGLTPAASGSTAAEGNNGVGGVVATGGITPELFQEKALSHEEFVTR